MSSRVDNPVSALPGARRERSAQPENQEIRPLTGVRAFAALWVVLLHFHPEWARLFPGLQWIQPLAMRGHLGVDLFFCLSGFILSYVYLTGTSTLSPAAYKRFLWLRLARIYPVHLATFGGLALLVAGAGFLHLRVEGEYPLHKIPYELTMTHAWWWFLAPGGWNYPSWSISAEWFAYLFIFPLSAWVLQMRFRTTGLLLIGYCSLAVWLSLLTAVDERGLARVSCEFLAGAMTFGAFWGNPALARGCQRSTTLLVLAMLVIALLTPLTTIYALWAIILLIPPLLIGLTSEASLVGRVLAHPVTMWGGRISYSLYMTHAIVQKVVKVLLPTDKFLTSPWGVRGAVIALQLAALLAAAALLYHFVEVPARDALRRFASRRRARLASLNPITATKVKSGSAAVNLHR